MDILKVGTIVNTFGIRGEVKVYSTSDFNDLRFAKGKQVYLIWQNELLPMTIATYRLHKNMVLISFEGHGNINDVEKYKGCELVIDVADADNLAEDEYFRHELIGLEVQTISGDVVGEVIEIQETPAQNNLRVLREDDTTVLIPFVAAFIEEVDVEAEVIVIKEVEGLL